MHIQWWWWWKQNVCVCVVGKILFELGDLLKACGRMGMQWKMIKQLRHLTWICHASGWVSKYNINWVFVIFRIKTDPKITVFCERNFNAESWKQGIITIIYG